jgi:UTP--glucose-1-phosphate uridylyltransferase
MTSVRKAVITAAGRGTRQYPATNTIQKEMLPIVDCDGVTKPAIQIICEEALQSGIGAICIVVNPGADVQIRRHFQPLSGSQRQSMAGKPGVIAQSDRLAEIGSRLTFVNQASPEGYGHAVYQSREFVGAEPFLLMLGDHLYLSTGSRPCAAQAMDLFNRHGCSVSTVARTPESLLHLFGTIAARPLPGEDRAYDVLALCEKPSIAYAREHLQAPGLPPDEYLCFFGMHIFTPGIFEALDYQVRSDIREKGEIQLTSAQERLRQSERYLAFEPHGRRFDIGVPSGLAVTQIAFALQSPFKDALLAEIEAQRPGL